LYFGNYVHYIYSPKSVLEVGQNETSCLCLSRCPKLSKYLYRCLELCKSFTSLQPKLWSMTQTEVQHEATQNVNCTSFHNNLIS